MHTTTTTMIVCCFRSVLSFFHFRFTQQQKLFAAHSYYIRRFMHQNVLYSRYAHADLLDVGWLLFVVSLRLCMCICFIISLTGIIVFAHVFPSNLLLPLHLLLLVRVVFIRIRWRLPYLLVIRYVQCMLPIRSMKIWKQKANNDKRTARRAEIQSNSTINIMNIFLYLSICVYVCALSHYGGLHCRIRSRSERMLFVIPYAHLLCSQRRSYTSQFSCITLLWDLSSQWMICELQTWMANEKNQQHHRDR